MTETSRLSPLDFTITVKLDLSVPLQGLLLKLLLAFNAMPNTVSRDVSNLVGKGRQVAEEPGREFEVSLNSPATGALPSPVLSPPPPVKRVAKKPLQKRAEETRERLAWLTEAWRDGVSRKDALIALNAMPGKPLTSEFVISKIVNLHNLKRSPEAARRLQLAKVELMRRARGGKPTAIAATPPPIVQSPAPTVQRPSSPAVVARSRETTKPRLATSEEILRWGSEHGCHQDRLDLAKMNTHCAAIGAAPFELKAPARRAA